jgi:quinol-cytochrome oxidoreductase complex cytochrome b subunit
MRPNFLHHLHPPTIPAAQARWRYTLGAGGTAIFLVLVIAVSGVLEMFYYIPTPTDAALSIQTITYLVPFGGLIRNIHFWSAQLLIIVSAVHLARIVFTGAYIPPRRFNYLLGLVLFVFSILLNFTGYILRWDTGIQWALVVGTNLIKTIPLFGNNLYQILVGGTEPGTATLIRFYAWHIFGLSIIASILIGWHAFRVRRDGGIALPPPKLRTDLERISRFELVHRETLAMLLTSVALIVL